MSIDTAKWQRLPLDFQVHIQSNGYGYAKNERERPNNF